MSDLMLLLLVASVGAVVVLYMKLRGSQRELYFKCDEYGEVLDRALAAEGEKARIETEMEFQKRTLTILAQREMICVLNEQQASQLIQTVASIALSGTNKEAVN